MNSIELYDSGTRYIHSRFSIFFNQPSSYRDWFEVPSACLEIFFQLRYRQLHHECRQNTVGIRNAVDEANDVITRDVC